MSEYTINVDEALASMATTMPSSVQDGLPKLEVLAKLAQQYKLTLSKFTPLTVGLKLENVDVSGYSYSRGQVLAMMATMANQCASKTSPVEVLMRTADVVTVTPTKHCVQVNGKDAEYNLSGGYAVKEDNKLEVYFRNVLTAALASGVPQYATIDGKRQMQRPARPEGAIYPPMCVPSIHFLAKAYEGASNILDVREKIVKFAKKDGKMFELGALICGRLQSETDNVKITSPYYKMVKCVEITTDEAWVKKCESYKLSGKSKLPLPHSKLVFSPGVSKIQNVSIPQAFAWLYKNRESRGADQSGISPLTHGAYYGDLGPYYRGVTSAADIMHIQSIMNCVAVRYHYDSYFRSAWPVLSLNTLIAKDEILPQPVKGQTHGVVNIDTPGKKLNVWCVSSSVPRIVNGVLEYTPRIPEQLE